MVLEVGLVDDVGGLVLLTIWMGGLWMILKVGFVDDMDGRFVDDIEGWFYGWEVPHRQIA